MSTNSPEIPLLCSTSSFLLTLNGTEVELGCMLREGHAGTHSNPAALAPAVLSWPGEGLIWNAGDPTERSAGGGQR